MGRPRYTTTAKQNVWMEERIRELERKIDHLRDKWPTGYYADLGRAQERIRELGRLSAKRGAMLRMVLMFYETNRWSPRDTEIWAKYIGTKEVTTKNLCDAIRKELEE